MLCSKHLITGNSFFGGFFVQRLKRKAFFISNVALPKHDEHLRRLDLLEGAAAFYCETPNVQKKCACRRPAGPVQTEYACGGGRIAVCYPLAAAPCWEALRRFQRKGRSWLWQSVSGRTCHAEAILCQSVWASGSPKKKSRIFSTQGHLVVVRFLMHILV